MAKTRNSKITNLKQLSENSCFRQNTESKQISKTKKDSKYKSC